MKSLIRAIVAMFVMVGIATAEEAFDIPPVTLIQNVNVWDGLADDVQPGVDVLVVGNTIKKVAGNIPATATYEVDVKREKIKRKRVNAGTGEGYTLYVVDEKGGTRTEQVPVKVIDAKGGTLIPGLIDMHVHLATAEGLADGRDNWDSFSIGAVAAHNLVLFFEQGFTTVRGAGGPDLGLAKAIRAGRIPGPRFYPAGPWISQTAGHADLGYWTDPVGWKDYSELSETSHVVDGRAEILKAVRYNLRKGATHIKLMGGGGVSSEFDPLNTTQFTFDEMKAAVEAAEDWGTYVMMHAYHDRSVNRAIDAGVKCIEHGALLSEKTVKRMADEGIVWSLQGFMGYDSFSDPAKIPAFFTEDQKKKAAQLFEGFPKVAKWAQEHGVFIVSGADTFGVDFMKRNIENVLIEPKLGFSNKEALQHHSSNAGKVLKEMGFTDPALDPYPDGKLGVVVLGAYADIVIVDGNPLKDLTILRDYRKNMKLIMKNGIVLKNTLVEPDSSDYLPNIATNPK